MNYYIHIGCTNYKSAQMSFVIYIQILFLATNGRYFSLPLFLIQKDRYELYEQDIPIN